MYKEYADECIKNEMTWADLCYLITSQPAAVSIYFNKCVKKFISCVIKKFISCVFSSQCAPLGSQRFFIMLNFNNVVVLIYMVYCRKRMHQIWKDRIYAYNGQDTFM